MVMTIPALGYCELTYKYPIPLRDIGERFGTAAFSQTVAGATTLAFRLKLLDYAGTLIGTTADAFITDRSNLPANVTVLPNYMNEVVKADRAKMSRAASVVPVFSFVANAAVVTTVPVMYFGL